VPCLEIADGVYISQINAIFRTLGRESSFMGEGMNQKAEVDMWLDFIQAKLYSTR